MVEKNDRKNEHFIIPSDIYKLMTVARRETFALADVRPQQGTMLPGSEKYIYEDDYFLYENEYIEKQGPMGKRSGIEIVKNKLNTSIPLMYLYTSGLTLDALKLDIDKNKVYGAIRHFMWEHTGEIRVGQRFKARMNNEDGRWILDTRSEARQRGWRDRERVFLNRKFVYELVGDGNILRG